MLSNFRVNTTKSEVLDINGGKLRDKAYQKCFPFIWDKKELKYLGVKIATTKAALFQVNFMSLLNERISHGQLSWGGRINIYKMVILPKITYKMQMLPVALPQVFLRSLHTMFLKFIWRGKKPCLNFAQLTKEKGKGGWEAPDIRKYYEAIALARVIDWVTNNKDKHW